MVSAPSNHCYVPGTIFELDSGERMPAEEIASQYARHDKSGMTLAIRVLAPFGMTLAISVWRADRTLDAEVAQYKILATEARALADCLAWPHISPRALPKRTSTRSSLRNIHNCKNKYP